MHQSARILLVEDEEIIALIIEDLLVSSGFQVTACGHGQTAWECLQANENGYDLVLLDRNLPDMNGMEFLRRIKGVAAFAQIPVIFESSQDDMKSIREGMEQGAYYYLVKPIHPELLLAVINAALQQSRELRGMLAKLRLTERPIALLQTGVFHFRDLEEARLLAHYLALACPIPEQAILGLQELLMNAVEHGNLAISYTEKGSLILNGNWQDEIRQRLELPAFKNRFVAVHFQRQSDSITFIIQDQGEGFNWQDYLDFSPERAFDLHGRGIAMARKLSFDALTYQGNGNTAVATVNLNTTGQCG